MTSKGKFQILAIEASPKQQRRGVALTSVEVPKKWLLPAADGTKPFTSVIDQTAYGRWNASFFGNQFTLIFATTMPTFMGGVALAHLPGNNLLLDLVGWGIAGVSAAASIFRGWQVDSIASKRRKAVARHAFAALEEWLQARYNLKVQNVISNSQGVKFLLSPQPIGASMIFMDDQGRSFKIIHGATGLYVEEHRTDGDYAPSGTMAAITPLNESNSKELESLLTGDAQALHSRTETLLTTLSKRNLSTEGQHVFKRVQEDLRQMLILNRELHELGEIDGEAQEQLAVVLSNLNDELDEVLAGERASVKRQITTQASYVKERRRALASGLLLEPSREVESRIQSEKATIEGCILAG